MTYVPGGTNIYSVRINDKPASDALFGIDLSGVGLVRGRCSIRSIPTDSEDPP
jgi:hypothetical protein